ncbi:MAG: imidazole glycerol phosphate synthase subunit HisH [Ruminococcaceae bacterium]|nr:imidazole glycerol phosphate synthase subunit HisH [Oscillospiraceae bacterium]
MTVIIDYGVGNLFSLTCSFKKIGADVIVSSDPEVIKSADWLILPGVGAFKDAAEKLRRSGLDRILIEKARSGCPVLGICLGMQLLFERSFEYGEHRGLGLLKGDIVPFKGAIDESLKIPHIGWNSLEKRDDCPLFKHIKDGDFVYFVHSFFADFDTPSRAAWSDYGIPFTAAVWDGNIFGCQFHPEKSGDVGLNILRAFIEIGEN